ncbi:MAG TPA: 2-oxo-4-hydroxy-4-carboxy-5-ureidoimidazoline decarboxylase [Beutenbergiaceae bacterium]|nr:2-oxo-4-hydroxy-4-carboxy-5-ureidoimidazoline decarboxylase [Beutenbergiaceae bacterium]
MSHDLRSGPLAQFNALPDDEARALLERCAAVPRWARDVAAGRPYATVEEALDAARTAAEPWTDAEIDSALARHPRIGQRPTGADAESAHSRREQSGVDPSDTDVAAQLAEGNRAYEERFGHVFLIRAAGRSAAQILQALQERLQNEPETERRIAAAQLREIAVLRLEQELT